MRIRIGAIAIFALSLSILIDIALRSRKFGRIRMLLAKTPVKRSGKGCVTTDDVATAVSMAANWYQGCSPCLVRSVVAAWLLRVLAGADADVVLGVTQIPVTGHAWVEIDSVVIFDDQNVVSRYAVVDRLRSP